MAGRLARFRVCSRSAPRASSTRLFVYERKRVLRGMPAILLLYCARRRAARRLAGFWSLSRGGCWRALAKGRAGCLETLGLVHEHEFHDEFVIILREKLAGFGNLGYTRIGSISADCSARLACDIDAEEGRATVPHSKPGSRARSGTAIKMFLGCSRSRSSASVADQLDRPPALLDLVSLTELSPMLVP